MMKKRVLSLAAIAFFSAMLTSCADRVRHTFVMAEVNPADSIAGQMDIKFAEEVERLSNGRIKIDLYASAILGDETIVLKDMFSTKKIDLARISLFSLNPYGAEKAKILTIPYIFNDRDHFWKFAQSDAALPVLLESSAAPNGVMGLFLAEEGFRNFFATRPINSPEDMKGLKVRTTSDPLLKSVITSLGAEPIELPFFDIIKEMVVGTVDAAEQPIVNYKANFFDSAAPYMILDGHSIGVVEVIITKEAWGKLSSSEQQILIEAGRNAQNFCRELSVKKEEEAIAGLKSNGAVLIQVADKQPWKDVCREIIDTQAQADYQLYESIVELGK